MEKYSAKKFSPIDGQKPKWRPLKKSYKTSTEILSGLLRNNFLMQIDNQGAHQKKLPKVMKFDKMAARPKMASNT
jgi:hypothetical protein